MVELRPLEFPATAGSTEQSHRAANKGRLYLHYRRFAMPVAEALVWYEAAIEGKLTLPAGDDQPQASRPVLGGPFFMSPAWPRLVVSNDLDFAPDWMQGSPAHFLFAKHGLDQSQLAVLRKSANNTRLRQWLHIDLVDLYRDYLGAICLLAPNPSFRTIEKSHLDTPRNGPMETVAYKLVARANQSLNGICLEIINETALGRLTPATAVFSDDAPISSCP